MTKTYAIHDTTKLLYLVSTDEDIETMFHADTPIVDVTGATPAPQQGWAWDGKAFKAPPPLAVNPPTIRTAMGGQLIDVMTDDEEKAFDAALSAGTLAMRTWWSAHYLDLIPETANKIVRLADTAKVDLKALYDKIYGVGA